MEPTNIFKTFFSLQNPTIYGIIIVILGLIIFYLIKKEFISPLRKTKKELELKNLKLMALFSEVDPDPVIRIDHDWKILELNKAAENEFENENFKGKNIKEIFPEYIDESASGKFSVLSYNKKYYSAITKNIDTFEFKHIYLRDITQRIEYEILIKKNQVNLKKLKMKVETVNEEEKNRLGKELHDGPAQNLLVLKLALQNQLDENGNNENERLKNMINITDDLITEVREISHQLRPRILNEFGLTAGLTSIIDKINSENQIKGYLTSSYKSGSLSKELELNIYRICQECISNIIKHAECKEFFIQLIQKDDQLKLVISDDGKGFNVDEYFAEGNSSLGLLNIKERVENYEGSVNIISSPGEGTTIFVKFQYGIVHDKNIVSG